MLPTIMNQGDNCEQSGTTRPVGRNQNRESAATSARRGTTSSSGERKTYSNALIGVHKPNGFN